MSRAIFLAPVKSQNATTRCPKVCVIIEANDVLPVTDFVNPMLMFKQVRK